MMDIDIYIMKKSFCQASFENLPLRLSLIFLGRTENAFRKEQLSAETVHVLRKRRFRLKNLSPEREAETCRVQGLAGKKQTRTVRFRQRIG